MTYYTDFADIPRNRYKIILCDPPWRFEVHSRDTGLHKSADRYYPTMKASEIGALPVSSIAAPNSFLILWVYDPLLPQAIEVARQWGFKYVTVLFRWLKQNRKKPGLHMGTGYHSRGGGCEECWLFKRGHGLPVLAHDIRREFFSPIREHSRKPEEVHRFIERLYVADGDVPRLELFARGAVPGWSSWGNEVGKFNA